MPTSPPVIPGPLLPAPNPSDRITLGARLLEFVRWVREDVYGGMNAIGAASLANATEAAVSAQVAIDAAAGVAAPVWTAGTYATGVARYDPGNQLLYRRLAPGGVSSVTPSADPTGWKLMADEFTEVIVTGSTHTAAHRTTIKIRTAGACTVTMPTLTNGFRCDIKVENGRMDNLVDWGGAGHEDSTDATMLLDDPYEFIKITGSNVWRIST
jgi:hypothetical protein